jgi:hypothetical protein
MDASPRQILSVRRTFRPDGLTRPIVAFRPRPRDFLTLLRNLRLNANRKTRQFQNQLIAINSSVAALNDANIAFGLARLPMPADYQRIAKLFFIIHDIAGGTWGININSVATGITGLTEAGRYDVTPWAEKGADTQQITGSVTASAGGSNAIRYSLEAIVVL